MVAKTMFQRIKTGVDKLFSTGFFHIFGSSVINKVLGFLCGIILVRVISKADYGVYTYANNIYSFFLLTRGLGMASAILQVCSEKRDEAERQSVYSMACAFGSIFNIVIAIVMILVAMFVELPIKGANSLLALMLLLPFAEFIPDIQKTYMRTQLRSKEYASSNTISTVAHLVLVCGLSFLFGSKGLIAGTYLTYVFGWALNTFYYRTPITLHGIKTEKNKEDFKSLFKIGGISVVNNGLSQLMYLLDIFIIGLIVVDEYQIASYKIATYIPTALLFIPSSVIVYVYPYFARNKDNKHWLKKNFLLLYGGMGACMTFVSAVGIVLAPIIIKIVFGEQYLDAVPAFRILMVSFALSSVLRVVSGNLLVSQRKIVFNLVMAVFSSLLNTGLNVLFISNMEAVGAAIATLITACVSGAINTAYLVYLFFFKKTKELLEEEV